MKDDRGEFVRLVKLTDQVRELPVKANPDAHPLFHSDGGFQYTNRTFHHKLYSAA